MTEFYRMNASEAKDKFTEKLEKKIIDCEKLKRD